MKDLSITYAQDVDNSLISVKMPVRDSGIFASNVAKS